MPSPNNLASCLATIADRRAEVPAFGFRQITATQNCVLKNPQS